MVKVIKKCRLSCQQQLKSILREMIYQNRNVANFAIPTEEKLCEYHDLARGTVRKAIAELVADGLLLKRPGKGTFINQAYWKKQGAVKMNGGLIALLTTLDPDCTLTYDLIYGIERILSPQGYFLVVKFSLDSQSEKDILQVLPSRCEGIIAYSRGTDELSSEYAKLQKNGYPFVLIDRYFSDLETSRVICANQTGMRTAAEHFIRKGLRRFLYLTIKDNVSSASDRLAGFRSAISSAPGTAARIEFLEYSKSLCPDSLREILRSELEHYEKIAVLANHDGLAAWAFDACRELGVEIPRQVEIMGFGDEQIAREKGISSMRFLFSEMAQAATNILLDNVEHRTNKIQQLQIDVSAVFRKTTS